MGVMHCRPWQGISSHFSINAKPRVLLLFYSSIQHSIWFISFWYQCNDVLEAIRHDFYLKNSPSNTNCGKPCFHTNFTFCSHDADADTQYYNKHSIWTEPRKVEEAEQIDGERER